MYTLHSCLFFHMISQKPMQTWPNHHQIWSSMSSGNPFILGQRSRGTKTLPVRVMALLWVLASSLLHVLLVIELCWVPFLHLTLNFLWFNYGAAFLHLMTFTDCFWGGNAPWFICWFWRYINCLFVYLASLLFSYLTFFFPYTFFLTYLLPYSFNRSILFPGWRL